MTIKEPIGVVGQILPWNFPLLLASWKMAPALAAGCAMVIKPSELTPLGTLELARICEESGVPPGVINVCQGVGEICGDAIVKNSNISKISFTGSTLVGKQIVKNSAENLSRVSLELGGKAPNIVFEDANIELKDNQLTLEKYSFDLDERKYFIKIYFENDPLVLRKVEVRNNQESLTISIFNHNYNEELNKDLFKLINPKLLN